MKEQRGARLGSKRSFSSRPSPPHGKTTNDFGKLRALEVRLVREVKVLNQFFAANVNAFERYMKA